MQVSLVPAYQACTSPNRTHGTPLAFGSCSPPTQASDLLTVGTPDANQHPANANGMLRLDAVTGNPATPADEADVQITLRLTDVYRRNNFFTDYFGEVRARLAIQLTDKDNGCCGFAGTLRDAVSLEARAFCEGTPSTSVGSTCAVTTTAEALIPGMVREGRRAVWELARPVRVYDDGPSQNGSGATLFAMQGVFVP